MTPSLTWDGVPHGTAGLVLLVDDPDAPVEGSFVHWVLFDLDPARQGIAEGEVPAEATAGASGFGRPGYLGARAATRRAGVRQRLELAHLPAPNGNIHGLGARMAQPPGKKIPLERA